MTIEVVRFKRAYPGNAVVGEFNFTVAPGQILGLVGTNGAGKTTVLRTLAGLSKPTEGEVRVAGFDVVTDRLEVKARCGYMPDHPSVFPELTVQQHLRFMSGIYGCSNPDTEITSLLDRFSLGDQYDTPAAALSRGMLQKLSLCSIALQRPSAVLLDEPLSGLDPPGICLARDLISELAASGTAVIVSSHLLREIERICTHVVLLSRGQQLYFGELRELEQQAGGASSLEQYVLEATRG